MLSIFSHYFLYLNTKLFHIEFFYAVFYYLIPFLSLTSMPLIYLYVKHMTTEDYPLMKRLKIHFLPAVISLFTTVLLILMLNTNDREAVFRGETEVDAAVPLFVNYVLTSFAIILQVFIYSIRMFRLLYRHESNVEKYYSYKQDLTLKWLKIFVVVYFIYYLFEFTVFIFKGINISETVYFSIISLHVFFVGFMGLKQRDIYLKSQAVQPVFTEVDMKKTTAKDVSKEPEEEQQRKLSVVTPEMREEVLQKMDVLMNEKKIYLSEDLSLYDLAQELDINKNYLSHIINDSLDTNFYNLINSYRIEEAKKMLTDSNYENLSVEGIAQSVGFKSRSVFYPVFKKFVGETPTEYKKRMSETK